MSHATCAYCSSPLTAADAHCPTCGSVAARVPEKTLPLGATLHHGKFSVGRVLGEGGFGITYKGAHRELQRPVAIKELFPVALSAVRTGARISVPSAHRDDFRRAQDSALEEARIIAGFRSPHIVDVYDMFRENGTAYIVMEYLDGPTLETRLRKTGLLSADEARHLALNLCEALEEMHGRNLLHRDIKPANIVWLPDDRTVLIDFGSTRTFHTGRTVRHTRILTEEYAAPEQYSQPAPFGPYTDLFCLGATLYHALTGAPPADAVGRLQGRNIAFPADLEETLRTALQRALELQVKARPQTVADFRRCLLGTEADTLGHPDELEEKLFDPKTVPAPDAAPGSLSAPDDVAALRPAPDQDAAIAYFNQGYAHGELGRHAEAIAAYDQALRLDPDNAAAYFNRGLARSHLGRHAASVADYGQALRLDPDNAAAYFNRGYDQGQLGQHAKAVADYDQALRLNPNDAVAYFNRGLAKKRLDRHADAIADYDQALRLDPDNAAAYFNRGYARGELGRHADAVADYDQALRLDPDNIAAYFNRGYDRRQLGRYAEAIADYDQVICLEPNDAAAYFNRGLVRSQLDRHAQAIADYDHALRLDPKHAAAYRSRGFAHGELGRHAQAIADYDRALRLNPDDDMTYVNRGYAKVQVGDHRAALADYEQALRLNPQCDVARRNRAIIQQALGA